MFRKLKQKLEEAEGDSLKKVAESFAAALPVLNQKITGSASQTSLRESESSLVKMEGPSQEASLLAAVTGSSSEPSVGACKMSQDSKVSESENNELETFKRIVADLELTVKNKDELLITCSEENAELLKNVEEFKGALEACDNRNKVLEESNVILQSEVENFVRKQNQLKDDLTLSLTNIQLEKDLQILSQKNEKMESQNKILQFKIEELEAEMKILQTKEKRVVETDESCSTDSIENSDTYKLVKARNDSVSLELEDKNKTIKQLQQRLSDIKKELQKQMKSPSTGDAPCHLSPNTHRRNDSTGGIQSPFPVSQPAEMEPNFQYLKNVIFKFLTSSEYEAKHLVRAVSTLLKLSKDEEQYLSEMLEWRTSWFGSRPYLRRRNIPA